MRMTRLVGRRYKDKPAEAALESHAFMLRGAYARQVANGIYSLLPAGLRVIKKIERIIREEMDRIGGQEVLMPVVQPKELWEESGRYSAIGSEMARFEDRAGHPMVLAMTHEEAVVSLCRHEIYSYKQLPFMVYQLQTKFRDEPRSRGGLIRVREFTMKDAYSFHESRECLEEYYGVCMTAYRSIFARVGIPETAVVESDTGMMGGSKAHEFMLLCDAGEDTIVCCDSCGYMANKDTAVGEVTEKREELKPLEKVATPGMKTIEEVAGFLGVEPHQTAKVVFYETDSEGKPVLVMLRGDYEVNEAKLARTIKVAPVMASDETIRSVGAVPGFASPIGISPDDCRIIIDFTAATADNLVCGANEEDYHYKNFNLARDLPGVETVDISSVKEGDGCKNCGGKLLFRRGIEVGNIFQLGKKYSEAMNMRYLDKNGSERTPLMGCYGIGVGRLFSSVMEVRRDDFGPVWPINIAPWEVHICALNYGKENVRKVAEKIHAGLRGAGLESIIDDRNERAGVQFADADLLGVPFRVVISPKTLKSDSVEWRRRDGGRNSELVHLDDIIDKVKSAVEEEKHRVKAEVDEQFPMADLGG